MATPNAFLNFPNESTYAVVVHEYNRISDLADWDWTYSGHLPPDTLEAIDGGAVVLGGLNALDESFLNGQYLGASVKLNRLNKTYQFEWTIQLDSATLTECMIGVCATNTNLLNTCITDGFGFYVNGPLGPAVGTWHVFNAFGAVTQYTDYSGYAGPAADTNVHTFAIRVITDSAVTGAGRIVFFMDGVQIGNGLASSSAFFTTGTALRVSIAMGNGTAVARSVTLYADSLLGQR